MKRIQRQRTKGWRMPEGAIYVGRPSRWGNPFPVEGSWITWTAVALGYRADAAGRRRAAVELYRAWMTDSPVRRGDELGDLSVVEYTDGSTATISDLAEDPYPDRAKTALRAAGYKRVSARQLAMLAEIAAREGWPQVLGWIATRPDGVDPIAHVKSSSNGQRADRLRRADERDEQHAAAKARDAGPIAAALAGAMNGAGHPPKLDRPAAIERFRAFVGQVPDDALERQLAPYGLTLADLADDGPDFGTGPDSSQEQPHA